jgi:hypothetical protein
MAFNLDDYVDVAERLRQFKEKYPDGSLQGRGEFILEPVVGYLYVAEAYRTADDERPGVGTAFEPIPGKTPYTRDSEVQNAETAAWGRAIVALGFETKKIASKQEVQGRQNSQTKKQAVVKTDDDFDFPAGTVPEKPSLELLAEIRKLAADLIEDKSSDSKKLQQDLGKLAWREDPTEAQMAHAKLKIFFSPEVAA